MPQTIISLTVANVDGWSESEAERVRAVLAGAVEQLGVVLPEPAGSGKHAVVTATMPAEVR